MRDYEDMSKQELITLVKRLSEQHNEWRNETIELREEYDYFIRPASYLLVDAFECGCGREMIHGQSHCFCDYEYQVEGMRPALWLKDEPDNIFHTISEDEYIEEREVSKQARLRKEMKA